MADIPNKGDRRHVGLPVFPVRNFTARDLYVRKERSVESPADLIGKRIGMYDWVASGSIWYRHFLSFIGVPPESLEWWIGNIDAPRATTHLYTLPTGVHQPPEGRSLSEMLIAGEFDAIYSPPRPQRYDPVNGPIVRLFSDIRAVERDYFVILRRDVWEREKWSARSLTGAFIRCNDQFATAQGRFPYVSPWLDIELEETEALMGIDFYPYGFEKNRTAVQTFCHQAHELGIVSRPITTEEYFAEYLAS